MPTVAPKSLRAPRHSPISHPVLMRTCLCAELQPGGPSCSCTGHYWGCCCIGQWRAFSFPGLADITAGPLGDVPTTACKYGCNVVCYVLHDALLRAARRAVHVVCCVLSAVCCTLHVACCCLLSVARCMLLSAVCCTLFVVCCVGPQVSGDSGSIALVDVKRGTVISVRTHHWPGTCTAGRSPAFALPSVAQPHLRRDCAD